MADIRTQLQKIVDRRNRRLGIKGTKAPVGMPKGDRFQTSSSATAGSVPGSGDNDPRYDATTGGLMQKRKILDDAGNLVAVLDYHERTKSWFLDIDELSKIRNVKGIVSQILTHESQ
jgi:hypothetical protein